MNILFVCTGNTCRSSMAEGIFKHMLKEKGIENINVSSAGLHASDGDNANEKAIYTLNQMQIDISNHKARQLSKKILQHSDLILTMTNGHKRMILNSISGYSNKIFTLKEYASIVNDEELDGKSLDIDDPFGLDYNVYEKVAEEIREQLLKIIKNLDKIKKL